MQQGTSRGFGAHAGYFSDDGESGTPSKAQWIRGAGFPPIHALVLGSFPPRECGIATFTRDVVESLAARGDAQCDVIAIDESGGEARAYAQPVVHRLASDKRSSHVAAATFINSHPASVLLVQHEYGLFGGKDGEAFLDLLAAVRKPVIVTLHTISTAPTEHHRLVTQRICELATTIVVHSQTGKDILLRTYTVNEETIRVIPHGVPDVAFSSTIRAKHKLGLSNRKTVTTFGLLSRGKGLEDAIAAMRTIADEHPEALYLVLGQTHPLVRQHEGESYRESLHALVAANDLERNVSFVDRYLSLADLLTYLSATDIYLTPYRDADQIVSGTLAYALGCGKASVSTPYLYAKEALARNRGSFCDFRNPTSIARCVTALLDDPRQRRAMEQRAYEYGHKMRWSNVAASVFRLLHRAAYGDALTLQNSGATMPMLAASAG